MNLKDIHFLGVGYVIFYYFYKQNEKNVRHKKSKNEGDQHWKIIKKARKKEKQLSRKARHMCWQSIKI